MIKKFFINGYTWLGKQKKEIFLVLFGATVSFAASIATMHFDKSAQERKELRQQKEAYVTAYFKALNQKFNLFVDLVDEVATVKENKVDSGLIADYTRKLEEARTEAKVNSYYDKVQFLRFFDTTIYNTVARIDIDINDYAQSAEANQKEYVDALKIEEGKLRDRILAIEKQVFERIDKD